MIKVVGCIFRDDNKLLLVKPRKRLTLQMVGGKVEEGEKVIEAIIRESHEELGPKAVIDHSKFEFIMDFVETATSDPNLKIHFHLFIYLGTLEGSLTTSDEIESFTLYDTSMKDAVLSHVLNNKVIPYCVEKNLIR